MSTTPRGLLAAVLFALSVVDCGTTPPSRAAGGEDGSAIEAGAAADGGGDTSHEGLGAEDGAAESTAPASDGASDGPGIPPASVVLDDYAWKYTTPSGLVENPGDSTYVKDGLTFRIDGWRYAADVSDGSVSVAITPMNATAAPLDVSGGQGIGVDWVLTPLSVLHANSIAWAPGSYDVGYTVYHLLENGVLDVTWSNAGSAESLKLATSAPPMQTSAALFTAGSVRIRVLAGSVAASSSGLTVTPSSAGAMQVVLYGRSTLDGASFDVLGAVAQPMAGEVVASSGFTVEKSLRVRLSKLGVDEYLGIDPATPTPQGVIVDDGAISVTDASGSTANRWSVSRAVESITKSNGTQQGPLTFRNFVYAFPGVFGTQTFNFYLVTPRGTMTFWSVGRITKPYSVYFYPKSGVHLFWFPESQVDGAEDGYMTDTITTSVVYALQDTSQTLVTAEAFHANADLQQTSISGNSVDPGWRHHLATPLGDVQAIVSRNGAWSTNTSPTGGYYYTPGDAGYVVGSASRYFVMKRLWQGQWSGSPDVLPSYCNMQAYNNIFGFMKGLDPGAVTPSGSDIVVNHVVQLAATGAVPDSAEAEATYQAYFIPANAPTTSGGMIDLSSPAAATKAAWDIGWWNGEPRVFSMK